MRIVGMGLTLLLVLTGAAQAAELALYDGDAEKDRGGIVLGAWGSGDVSESYEVHYVGPRVLKVLSQGYYQGGVLTWKDPAPLAGFLANPDAYLELWVKPSVVPTVAAGKPIVGGIVSGQGQSTLSDGRPTFLLKRLRIVLLTDKGELIADGWPLYPGTLGSGGWRKVAIPLSVFKSSLLEKGAKLQEVRIFADKADVFYVGQIRVVVDDTPLRVKVTAEPNSAKPLERIRFHAEVDSGDASTLVSWDFDDRDGIQTDAQGARVEWIYQTPGSYVVTCTVSDVYGSRGQEKATLKVRVSAAEEGS